MKLLKVRCVDAEIGNISIGMVTNGKSIKIGEDKWLDYDEKAGNITVNGKMYTFYLLRGRRKTKLGFNGGHILGVCMENHYKDPVRKKYFDWGYGSAWGSGVDLDVGFHKKTPTWHIKPTTPEAKAAFEALVKKYN